MPPRPDDLPVLFLPRNLSAEAAAHFIDALHQLIAAMERHYGAQSSTIVPTDPPF